MAKKIPIKGDIIRSSSKWIYDWLGIEATAPSDVSKLLAEANGEDVEVEINSGGGEIFAGSEIYTALRSYKGNVQINIVGLAASAASVIAMAGKSRITPTGMMMIHNVSTGVHGDHNAMEHTADTLRSADQSIANAYKAKTGLTDKQLLDLMDKETWMSAEQAVKNKFVDEVMFEDKSISLYNSASTIKPEAIEKLRNLIKPPRNDTSDFLLAQTKFNYLRLGGHK